MHNVKSIVWSRNIIYRRNYYRNNFILLSKSTSNLAEELIDTIKVQLGGYDNGWGIELESPEKLSFVIGYQGLLL